MTKPGVVNGQIEIRDYLFVTISFDHQTLDGAPAARFAHAFRKLVEHGSGLEQELPVSLFQQEVI